jgi:16S rRNA (adenine1518-N6/adenine1519-N6)-dimethyltransferase
VWTIALFRLLSVNNMPIRPKKSLGQNFLKDPHYLRKIVEAAAVTRDDQVLEIGPGLGHLTRELAARAGRVVVVELDDRLVPVLRRELAAAPNVEIVHADALAFDYGALAGTWKVVANLPYYISTPLIERLISWRSKFATLTLMLQKEVAERIAADPGGKDYGVLTVMVQLHAEPSIAFTVPPGAFTPPPKVDSAVVTLRVRRQPAVAVADEQFLEKVVKTAFSQRRKTLRNSLGALIDRTAAAAAAQAVGISPDRRPETLSLDEFGRLADALRSCPAAGAAPGKFTEKT